MSIVAHTCQECGNHISGRVRGNHVSRVPGKLFCSTPCRQTFNNRRMQRGADIYDLFRALRRERSEAKRLNIWTEICRLELGWQQEDETERGGRKSYMPPRKALDLLRDKGSLPRGDLLQPIRAGR